MRIPQLTKEDIQEVLNQEIQIAAVSSVNKEENKRLTYCPASKSFTIYLEGKADLVLDCNEVYQEIWEEVAVEIYNRGWY